MINPVKVALPPEFDRADSLDTELTIAAHLTRILDARDAALLQSALGGQ